MNYLYLKASFLGHKNPKYKKIYSYKITDFKIDS